MGLLGMGDKVKGVMMKRDRVMRHMWPNAAPRGPIELFVSTIIPYRYRTRCVKMFKIGETGLIVHVPEDEPLQDTLNRFYQLGKEMA